MKNKRFIIQAGSRSNDDIDNYLKFYNEKDYDCGDRWNNFLGVKKHMIPIKGEPLIHRTQRLLLENGATDVIVKCNKEDIEKYTIIGCNGIENPTTNLNKSYPDHEFFNCQPLLNKEGVTVLLFGDIYYSENLIKHLIENDSEDWHYYSRWRNSDITGKIYGEMFAWFFNNNHFNKMFSAAELSISTVKNLISLKDSNHPVANLGWKMEDTSRMTYRILAGLDPEDPHLIEGHHWIEWNDESEDFDYPQDWINWSSRLPHLAY